MSAYKKFKYDGHVSEYKKNMIIKMIEYANGFCIKPEELEKEWDRHNLPLHIGFTDFNDLLQDFDNTTEFCIQDESGKIYFDYKYTKSQHYTVSYMANRFIMQIDKINAEFFSHNDHTVSEMSEYTEQVRTSLISVNTWLFSYLLSLPIHDDTSLEEVRMFYPNTEYLSLCNSLHRIVSSIEYASEYMPKENAQLHSLALYPSLIVLKNLSEFVSLCTLMCDSSDGSTRFIQPLTEIYLFLQYHFHDSYMYRLEIPISSVNTEKSIGERGPKDHTTLMKIYLFDKRRLPTLLRIDLPHNGSPFLHFNVIDSNGKKRDDNHYKINTEVDLDELIPILDGLKEALASQTPHMYVHTDTDGDKEKEIFEEMSKFVLYDELTLKYLTHEDYSNELKKVGGYLGIPKEERTLMNVLLEAKKRFLR